MSFGIHCYILRTMMTQEQHKIEYTQNVLLIRQVHMYRGFIRLCNKFQSKNEHFMQRQMLGAILVTNSKAEEGRGR